MICFRTGQPERALLEDGVTSVPQCKRQAQPLLDIAETCEPVLPPAVGARTRMVVREVTPGVAVRAVVLSDCAPLPFAEVRPPQIPVAGLPQAEVESAEAGYPPTLRTSVSVRHQVGPSCCAVAVGIISRSPLPRHCCGEQSRPGRGVAVDTVAAQPLTNGFGAPRRPDKARRAGSAQTVTVRCVPRFGAGGSAPCWGGSRAAQPRRGSTRRCRPRSGMCRTEPTFRRLK